VIGDGREHRHRSVVAFARDRGEIEAEHRVRVAHELEAHQGRYVGVGDAGLHEREGSRKVEVVGEALTK